MSGFAPTSSVIRRLRRWCCFTAAARPATRGGPLLRRWPIAGGTSYRVDLRGHGESAWPDDGDYQIDAFAADVPRSQRRSPQLPVLVGASLGGVASLVAIGESPTPVARALVLVDVAPTIERAGVDRIGDFMTAHMDDGFGSLEEVADAIADYNPHRPRPSDLSGLTKNLRQRDDGRWVWHWDPRFMSGPARIARRDPRRPGRPRPPDPGGTEDHRSHAAGARPGQRPLERRRCAGTARAHPSRGVRRRGGRRVTWWPETRTTCFNDAIAGFLDQLG